MVERRNGEVERGRAGPSHQPSFGPGVGKGSVKGVHPHNGGAVLEQCEGADLSGGREIPSDR